MKKQYFSQLLLTSLVQLILAFAVFTFVLHFFVMNYIENEIKRGDVKLVDLIQKSVDRQLASMDRITQALVFNPSFTPYELLENPYKAIEARSILKTIAVANPLMESIGTSYQMDDYLLTSNTSALKSRYFRILGFDSRDLESHDVLERGFIYNETYLIFLVPMKKGISSSVGYFFYVFDKRVLAQGLFPELNEESQKRYVTLYGPDGEILLDNFPESGVDPDNYIRSEFKSATTGLEYLIYSPLLNYRTFLDQLLWLFLLSIAVSVLLGGVLVLFFSRMNYAPVRHLSEMVNPGVEVLQQDSSLGEFEKIEQTLGSFMKFSDNPTALHDVEVRSLREDIARDAINGIYRSRESFIRDLKSADINSIYSFYGFVRVLISKGSEDLVMLTSFSSHNGMLNCLNTHLERNQILYLLNSSNETSAEDLLESFKKKQESQGMAVLTIGAGTIHDQPELLAQSFLESTTALEYRLVRGIGKIIQYKSIPKPDKINLNHVKTLQQQVRQAMLTANKNSIKDAVDRVIELSSDLSLSGARYVYWNLIRIIRETMDSYSLSRDEQLLLDELNVSRLTEFETLNELSSFITHWIDNVSSLIDNRKPDKNDATCLRVKDYILENQANPQLSLTDISHFTGLSQGHLCRIFKDHESKTMLQFIKDLRYDTSCSLLKETESPVSEIVQQIGYSDSASFIREFKKRYGLTPGQYREQFST